MYGLRKAKLEKELQLARLHDNALVVRRSDAGRLNNQLDSRNEALQTPTKPGSVEFANAM